MIGVILAAGQGTRMKALTAVRPKAMLPVAGLPVIARVVSQLRAAGITDIIVVVAAQDRHIRPYFEAHPSGRPPLQFVTQPVAGGMADALLYAAPHIQTPFILTACDSLYPDDHYRRLAQTHAAGNSPATLTLMELPPEEISRAGSVQLARGRVMRIVEKPPPGHAPSNIASLALYAFDTALLEYLHRIERSSRGELELQDAIQLLITDQGGLPGLMTPWRWELTAPADLLDMNLRLLAQQPDLAVAPPGQPVTPPVFVEPGVALSPNVQLGPHVYLEAGARIEPGARLQNCVVLRDGVVRAGQVINRSLISAAVSKT